MGLRTECKTYDYLNFFKPSNNGKSIDFWSRTMLSGVKDPNAQYSKLTFSFLISTYLLKETQLHSTAHKLIISSLHCLSFNLKEFSHPSASCKLSSLPDTSSFCSEQEKAPKKTNSQLKIFQILRI